VGFSTLINGLRLDWLEKRELVYTVNALWEYQMASSVYITLTGYNTALSVLLYC